MLAAGCGDPPLTPFASDADSCAGLTKWGSRNGAHEMGFVGRAEYARARQRRAAMLSCCRHAILVASQINDTAVVSYRLNRAPRVATLLGCSSRASPDSCPPLR